MRNKNNTNSYLKVSLVSLLALILAACGGVDSDELVVNDIESLEDEVVASRILFDPGQGVLPLPNDLLLAGTPDGTFEAPDEVAGRMAGNVDLGNPAVALGVADGWSTMLPMQLSLAMVDGATIDASTVNATTVVMLETVTPPVNPADMSSCIDAPPFNTLPPGLPCGVSAPLAFGTDFIAIAGEDTITISPITPLDEDTTYVVALLDGIMDSRGEPIRGSTLYEQVTRGDIDITFDGLDSLQDAINLYESLVDLSLDGDGSADALFSAAWTTASVGDVVATATTILANTPPSITEVAASPAVTVEQAFIAQGQLPPEAAGTTALQFADLYTASIALPYYSGTPADGSDPLANNWSARCDNPIVIAGATEAGALPAAIEPNNTICSMINPALGDFGLDTERYLTKFNPVPAVRDNVTLEVQITVPNVGTAFAAGPWPVVILQHGITANKETMLAVTGLLAREGFATFAIDHPLHGSRGLVSAAAGGMEVNAGDDATVYMNLANLPAGRDNLRQSMADMLGLRMAIDNDITGALTSANFDTTQVHILGMSLGAISATGFSNLANSLNLGPAIDLSVERVALSVPGGGIVPLLIESPSFGPLVQGSVLAGAADPEDATSVGSRFVGFIATNAACIENGAPNIGCNFNDFVATLDPASLAEINALIAQFAFAAQTIIDPADPNNYAAGLAELGTDIYVAEIVGDGINNLPDQVIPNQTVTPGLQFGGTEPLVRLLGLASVGPSGIFLGPDSGIVRFTDGAHGSLLDPTASAAVTAEMQRQIDFFLRGLGVTAVVGSDVLDPSD